LQQLARHPHCQGSSAAAVFQPRDFGSLARYPPSTFLDMAFGYREVSLCKRAFGEQRWLLPLFHDFNGGSIAVDRRSRDIFKWDKYLSTGEYKVS
jgi:hypothetical protein